MYQNPPQNPYRIKPKRRKRILDQSEGDPTAYSIEQIIEKAEAGDANCIEWLTGIILEAPAPIPKNFLRCSKCGCYKHKALFSDDHRNTGRYGKRSHCDDCRATAEYIRRHDAMIERISAVMAEVERIKPNMA